MAAIVKPVGSVGCCECTEVADPCTCGGGCTLECRSQADIATLCGYEEFGTASSPPRYYRKKTIAGTISDCRYDDGCDDLPACPNAVHFSGSGEDAFGVGFSWTGGLTPTGAESDTHVEYEAACQVFGGINPPYPARLNFVAFIGHLGTVSHGQKVWLLKGGQTFVQFQWNQLVWVTVQSECITIAGTYPTGTYDVWDIVCDYAPALAGDPPECELQVTNESARHVSLLQCPGPENEVDEEATAEIFGCDGLPGVYSSKVIEEVTSQTERTWSGRGCFGLGLGNGSQVTQGTVTEVLEDEDTELDAVERVLTDSEEWTLTVPPQTCATTTSYLQERTSGASFTFRKVQVRVQVPDPIPNASYRVTLRYGERPLAVGGPFLYLGREDIVTVQADADPMTEDWTEWIDLPFVLGLEIRIQSCQIELLP